MSSPILCKLQRPPMVWKWASPIFLIEAFLKQKRKMCIFVGREELPLGMGSGNGALESMQQVKFFCFYFIFIFFILHQSFICLHNTSVFKLKFIYLENYDIPFCLPPQSLDISRGQENTSRWSQGVALFLQPAACFKLEKPRPDP